MDEKMMAEAEDIASAFTGARATRLEKTGGVMITVPAGDRRTIFGSWHPWSFGNEQGLWEVEIVGFRTEFHSIVQRADELKEFARESGAREV